jgi:hypothetical protein
MAARYEGSDYWGQQRVLGPVGPALPPRVLIAEQFPGVGVPENCTPGLSNPELKHSRVLLWSCPTPEQLAALPAVSSMESQLAPDGDPQVQGPQLTDPDEPVYQGTAGAPPGQVVFCPSNSWQRLAEPVVGTQT